MKVTVYLSTGALIDVPVKTMEQGRKQAKDYALKGILVAGSSGRETYVLPHKIASIVIDPEKEKHENA